MRIGLYCVNGNNKFFIKGKIIEPFEDRFLYHDGDLSDKHSSVKEFMRFWSQYKFKKSKNKFEEVNIC